jgi:hypothetical protein
MKQIVNFNFQPPAMFVFFFKAVFLKVVHPLKIYQHTKFHGPTFMVNVLNPSQKFERPPLSNG